MKKLFSHALSAALVLAFLLVTSLAMVCAYHHGIDGLDQTQQGSSHTTLFCPSLSKVNGLALVIASGPVGFTFEALSTELIQSSSLLSSLFVHDHLARSPPHTLFS